MHTLVAHPISRNAFAPYGWLIDAAGLDGRAINAGNSERIDGLTELVLAGDGGAPCLAIFLAQARDLGGPWCELERHVLGTQTFVPLKGARCVVLVAVARSPMRPRSRRFSWPGTRASRCGPAPGITRCWHPRAARSSCSNAAPPRSIARSRRCRRP